MTNSISAFLEVAGITNMILLKGTSAIPAPPSASEDGLRLNTRGLCWDQVISMDMLATMAIMRILIQRK